MALGGLTKGVTVLDMTTAYGIIANKGVYVPAHTFTKILDSDGTVVIDNTPVAEKEISEDTAAQLTDMMQNVIKNGTAQNAIFKTISMPEAGKTGTTTSTKDKWFVGYTPYYAAGVLIYLLG
jgi:penicillin-binding protein 1A